ncbi:MAG TPA: hypothetical protein VFR24_04275 [Candidatus Angelobacter sp.]|nr:hypothetical protein [Candidatus Angelobacter sp.]
MAVRKTTRSRKPRSRMLRFSEVKGKTLEAVEVDPDVTAITILFEDKTALSFDLDPMLLVFPELGSLKTGNWRSRKRWPVMRSKPAMLRWP